VWVNVRQTAHPKVYQISVYEQNGEEWEKTTSFFADPDGVAGSIGLTIETLIHRGKHPNVLGIIEVDTLITNGQFDYSKYKERINRGPQ
jgi:hypothetical protein